ncbi:packaged DNA stabilization gp4 family protein [Pseudoalteromonas sp.]|uniref:packaged DNA stabilization gp4 family protein n=1 Tax=Pseudoalteromonas sp. TaxID=53249 RepID=UPI0035657851
METAQGVITDILQEVLVQASEQPVEAVDFQFVARYMNRYMAQLAVTVPLGYTPVSKPADSITIPDGAINGLIFNVALKILNSFDIDVGPTLFQNANDGLFAMRKISRNLVSTKHPSTLPIGSGNYECNGRSANFYSAEDPSILTEQNGNILLEDITNE